MVLKLSKHSPQYKLHAATTTLISGTPSAKMWCPNEMLTSGHVSTLLRWACLWAANLHYVTSVTVTHPARMQVKMAGRVGKSKSPLRNL